MTFQARETSGNFKQQAAIIKAVRRRYAADIADQLAEGDGNAAYTGTATDPESGGFSTATALDALWAGIVGGFNGISGNAVNNAGAVADAAADARPSVPRWLIIGAVVVGAYVLVNGGAKTVKNVKGIFS